MFGQYHRFRDCQRLQNTVQQLRDTSHVPDNIFNNYCRYHFSVLIKLRSAQTSLEKLQEYVSEPKAPEIALRQTDEFLFWVNFHLDSFLHFCRGALDVFARDVLCYYDLVPPPTTNVNFHTASSVIRGQNPHNPLLSRLQNPSWLSQFNEYRNCSTHEVVIPDSVNIEAIRIGITRRVTLEVKLPDNPRVYPRNYTRNINMMIYCSDTFSSILRLFHPIYSTLNNSINARRSLPLSP